MKKLVLIVIVFVGIFFSLAAQLNVDKSRVSLVVGKKFEYSYLKGIYNGAPVLVHKNRPVLVHVFASWCQNCKKDLPKIAKLKKKHNLQVIGFLWQDKILNVKRKPKYFKAYDVISYDPEEKLAFEMGITGVPETFLMSGDGTIVYNDKGELNEEDLLNALQIEFGKL